MEVILYTTESERTRVRKSLSGGLSLNGYLRDESSILKPVFEVEVQDASVFNYVYIPNFNRYYFVDDLVSVRTNVWRFVCSVDVLMSFATDVLNCQVVVQSDSAGDEENYMIGDAWQTTVRTKTDVLTFPNGLLDDGEFILITSGGVIP